MIVVVPAGSTPSGVGLALHEVEVGRKLEWQLQPLSPCCADFMDNHGAVSPHDESISAFCVACGEDWTEYMMKCGSTLHTSFELEWVVTYGQPWLARMFGYEQVEVTVE